MSRLPNTLGAPDLSMDAGQTLVRQVADRPYLWEVLKVSTHFYDIGIRSVYAPGRATGLNVGAGPHGVDSPEIHYINTTYPGIERVHFFGGPVHYILLRLLLESQPDVEVTSDAPFNLDCVKVLFEFSRPAEAIADLNALEEWRLHLPEQEKTDFIERLTDVKSVCIESTVPATLESLLHLTNLECVRLGHGYTHRRQTVDLDSIQSQDLALLGTLQALDLKCLKLHFPLSSSIVGALKGFTTLTELHVECETGFHANEVADAVKSLPTLRTLGLYFEQIRDNDHDIADYLTNFNFPNITSLTVGAEPDSVFFYIRTQFPSVQDVTLLLWDFSNESGPFDCGWFADCCPNVRTIKVIDWARETDTIANLSNVHALNQLEFLSSVTFNLHSSAQVEQDGDLNVPVNFVAVDNFQRDHPLLHSN